MSTESTHLTIFFFNIIFISTFEPSISIAASSPKFPCSGPRYSSFPFCNTSLPITSRARSLVHLLRLHEKISLLSDNASAVPRLGIPAYEWWSESLHGIATNGPGVSFNGSIPSATSFSQVILMAAAFNRSLWSSVGSAIAVEARAMTIMGKQG
ncbi:probable beta-D-xylosidase 6 isoform X2 [Punica granatum]|uniref:Probable beta-D-xylosidase 6 isoform X2 n=1 Tax=Punica granatum TaxID=22663 RepID=A0A6P8CUX2_PUNGR|nr:probable beta-D-xylosidase 6 isoform X2 [Punica granatum]